jgi:hypothetical protein
MGARNVLALVERRVPRVSLERRWLFFSRQVGGVRTHYDFAIDGKPLQLWIQEWEADSPERVTRLTESDPESALEQINCLLSRSPHRKGTRVWLLFCPECLDEDCGGITAVLTRRDGQVMWSAFGWDADRETENEETLPFREAGTFNFDAAQYERVLDAARSYFKAFRDGAGV